MEYTQSVRAWRALGYSSIKLVEYHTMKNIGLTCIETMVVACVSAVMTFAHDAQAAPFCAVFAFGTQCFYYTMDSCRMAAGTSGACVINQNEVRPPMGASGAPFCVVQSFGTQCFYYDAASCRQAAAMSGGACVVNSNR
jgi:hypothetical protein